MRKSDFIKVLKVSILIDLGMYFMALIKNGFDFHNVDYTKFVSVSIYILCICLLFKKVIGYCCLLKMVEA